MNHAVHYTKGKSKHFVRVLVDPELHKALIHDSADTSRTITEIVNLVLCNHYGRDPSDPSKPRSQTMLKAVS